MATINDRLTEVALALGNRADITTGAPPRIALWYRQSYVDIAMSFTFSELEDSTNTQLVTGQDVLAFPTTARVIQSLIAQDPNTGTMYPIKIKDIGTVRRYAFLPGAVGQGSPSICAFYGNKIHIRPVPDRPYNLIVDTWLRPKIADDIISTVLNVPDDWLEILDYGAILRGHIAFLERDKASALQQLLFGTNEPNGKPTPGLIHQKWTRYQANMPYQEFGFQPSSTRRSFTNV